MLRSIAGRWTASGSPLWAVLIGFVLVAWMTQPTMTRLTSVGRLDTNDGRYAIWNVAWIGHALTTDPASILDANIYWPHTGTLAYSEMNLVAGVFGLPWYAITGSPLAALNGSVFIALVLAFVLMWLLVRRLTRSPAAAYVSAVAFTFSPFVSARTPHIQLLMVFVYPLIFLAFHRLQERPTVGRGVELGATLAIGALACGYYGIYGGCALGLAALILARRVRAYWIALGTAVVSAGVFIAPVFYAFTVARDASGSTALERGEEAARWSANISAWLASSAAAHAWWLPALQAWSPWTEVLFPGAITIALAVCALVTLRRAPYDARVLVTYLAVAIAACWASFGPDAGLYRLIEATVPGVGLLRAPSRFGSTVIFALAVVAGFGATYLATGRRWLAPVLALALLAELGVRTPEWGWPSWPLREVPPLSPAYARLAAMPRAPMVEYPFPYVRSDYHNHGRAMFWSTYHWQPMVNGYSDVVPPDFDAIARPINGFPDEPSFDIMRERGVRYVLWHIDTYNASSRAVLETRLAAYAPFLRPLVRTPEDWLFEIVDYPSASTVDRPAGDAAAAP